jgi:hypothetical protein
MVAGLVPNFIDQHRSAHPVAEHILYAQYNTPIYTVSPAKDTFRIDITIMAPCRTRNTMPRVLVR